jgi:hypothetical protein
MRKLFEEEIEDIEQEIYTEIDEYLETNLSYFFEAEFLEKMRDEIYTWIEQQSKLENWNIADLPLDIEHMIQETCRYYDIPLRQNQSTEVILSENPKTQYRDKKKIESILLKLNQQPAIKQRTKEWYEIRQTCFSASNLWKVFSSQAQQNSLIYEKCNTTMNQKKTREVSNAKNPLNWGIKYEPVSIQIYEHRNQGTKVKTDYSCILHSLYSCIGASPDGIVISGENIGRMVEVKNIYNREITGIPLDEYWVQMQIQMETCDLEECDFLETRIQEYETEVAFYEDSLAEYKGVILFFLAKLDSETSAFFEYMPLYISLDKPSIQKWIEDMQEKHREYVLYETAYWRLDEYSCVLVERNNDWFSAVLPKIEAAWKMVESERITGYEHRAPNRKNNPRPEGEGSNRRNNPRPEGEGSNQKSNSIDLSKPEMPKLPENITIQNSNSNQNQIKVIKLSHTLLEDSPLDLDLRSLAW